MDTMPLLDEYVRTASQDAFRQIVERYINVVYAAARRQVHDEHLAQDVTQAVFFLLSRKAKSIPRNRPLTAWLLKTTRFAASNAWRGEQRRQKNETKAALMHQADHAPAEPESAELEAMLDEGINHLSGQDRDALLIKFFEQSSLREVGVALGISEDAAQKRVTRAVDRLRDFFRKRGVTVSAAVLTTFLATRSAEAAPAALTALAASAPIKGAASGTALSMSMKGVLFMATMEKIKAAAILTIAVVLAVGGGVVAVQYTSRGPEPSAAAAPAPPSTAPPAAQPFQVKFAGGTLVDLIGIQDEKTNDLSQWWGPDGLPHSQVYDLLVNRRANPDPAARNLRFVFQMTGPAIDDKTLHVDIVGAWDEATSGGAQRGASVRQMHVSLPKKLDTTALRIAVSNGPWADELSYDMATGQSTNFTDSGVRMAGITESNGMTHVELRFPLMHMMVRDERMILVVNDREILPSGIRREFGVTTFIFGCAKSRVTQAIFRSRPFEWIEMNNVSLAPTSTPTDVQIVTAPKPATAP